MSIVTELARWAHDLSVDDVPSRVLERVRLQHLHAAANVRAVADREQAASFAASLDSVARNRKTAAPTVLGGSVDRRGAARLHAALGTWLHRHGWLLGGEVSMAATTAAWACARGHRLDELLVATVAANEVAGRLGLSLFLHPSPEETWGHVQAVGATVAAGRLLGLDAQQLAHALALTLCTEIAAPHRARFGGDGGRLAIGAAPVAAAFDAVALAAAGMRGPLDILDAPGGPLEDTPVPLRAAFGGRGQAWLSTTLAYPQSPAPRGVQAAVQAVGEILDRHVKAADKRLRVAQVDRIEVALCADGMRSARHERLSAWDAEALHSDLPRLLGLLVSNHDIRPSALRDELVLAQAEEISIVAGRVSLEHSWRRTATATLQFFDVMAPVFAGIQKAELAAAFTARVGQGGGGVPELKDLPLVAQLRPAALADRFRYQSGDLADVRLEELQFGLGADVRLYTTRGGCWRASRDIPAGSPGWPWDDTVAWVLDAWGDRDRAAALLAHDGGDDADGWAAALLGR
ncbi:MAG: MmgE/PrpD family protein [Alphaproteobacteria bacterium]|nr:MmgE/PrpD family protein [Alphaproteobacteria bacterium]